MASTTAPASKTRSSGRESSGVVKAPSRRAKRMTDPMR
jgi:hypothetical protein